MKQNKKIITTILIIILLLIIAIIYILYKPINYKYLITYEEYGNTYNIYKAKNSHIIVKSKVICPCQVPPCPYDFNQYNIEFNDDNMITINNFIDSFFKNNNNNKITISRDQLDSSNLNIINSIIDNDETLLNTKINQNQQYTIITNMKSQTMLNDGGSHTNVYYEIDLLNNEIIKYEDHYIGFKGYEYQGKILYKKNINNDINIELEDLLSNNNNFFVNKI